MKVRVKLFSLLKEAVGSGELILECSGQEQTAGDLWSELEREFPALVAFRPSRAIAVNREHTREAHPVCEGDEVAFFPPISGG